MHAISAPNSARPWEIEAENTDDWQALKPVLRARFFDRRDDDVRRVAQYLSKQTLFQQLDEAVLLHLAREADYEEVPAGKTVINIGERGDMFYFLVKGQMSVSEGNPLAKVGVLSVGDAFGDTALVAQDCRHRQTVVANRPCSLLRFYRPIFTSHLRKAEGMLLPQLRAIMQKAGDLRTPDDLQRVLALVGHLPTFRQLRTELGLAILQLGVWRELRAGNVVHQQGSMPTSTHILLCGELRAHRFEAKPLAWTKGLTTAKSAELLGQRSRRGSACETTAPKAEPAGGTKLQIAQEKEHNSIEHPLSNTGQKLTEYDPTNASQKLAQAATQARELRDTRANDTSGETQQTYYQEKMVAQHGPLCKTLRAGDSIGDNFLAGEGSASSDATYVVSSKRAVMLEISKELFETTIQKASTELMASKMQLLEDSRLFHGCSRDDLAQVTTLLQDRVVQRGQLLFSEGEVASHLFIVQSGEVRLHHAAPATYLSHSPSRRRSVRFQRARGVVDGPALARAMPTQSTGACLGEEAVCSDRCVTYAFTATALVTTQLLALEYAKVLSVLNPISQARILEAADALHTSRNLSSSDIAAADDPESNLVTPLEGVSITRSVEGNAWHRHKRPPHMNHLSSPKQAPTDAAAAHHPLLNPYAHAPTSARTPQRALFSSSARGRSMAADREPYFSKDILKISDSASRPRTVHADSQHSHQQTSDMPSGTHIMRNQLSYLIQARGKERSAPRPVTAQSAFRPHQAPDVPVVKVRRDDEAWGLAPRRAQGRRYLVCETMQDEDNTRRISPSSGSVPKLTASYASVKLAPSSPRVAGFYQTRPLGDTCEHAIWIRAGPKPKPGGARWRLSPRSPRRNGILRAEGE